MVGNEFDGDCIFQCLPLEANLFDLPEAKLLYDLKVRGEFKWSRTSDKISFRDSIGRPLGEISDSTLYLDDYSYQVEPVAKTN